MNKLFATILMPFFALFLGIMLGKWSVFFPIIFAGIGIYLIVSFFSLSKGGNERSQFYFSYFFIFKFLGAATLYLIMAIGGFYAIFHG